MMPLMEGYGQGMIRQEPDVTGTRSLDMPQALQSLFSMQAPQPMQQPAGGIESRMGIGPDQLGAMGPGMAGGGLPSYQMGGMIGPDGMPVPEGMPSEMPPMGGMPPMGAPQGVGLADASPAGPMDPQMMEMNVNQFAMQNPQQMEEIRAAILQELQSGELSAQELNQIVQLATVASQNPEMYPFIRNFVIQQGIATPQDLPEQYDEGLVFTLLLAARAVQQDMGAGGPEMGMGVPDMGMGAPPMGAAGGMGGAMPAGMPIPGMDAEPLIPSMAEGGPVPGAAGSSRPVIIEAHTGEYVIPKQVVEMKGKEFFDNLVEKYRGS